MKYRIEFRYREDKNMWRWAIYLPMLFDNRPMADGFESSFDEAYELVKERIDRLENEYNG